MARWGPDTRERLQNAALELFEHGYDNATAAEIAERAGTAKSTFFRLFSDKREVLFDGTAEIADRAVAAIAATPPTATTFDLVDGALRGILPVFDPARRQWYARRQAVVAGNPELRERDLLKQHAQTAAITGALRDRGLTGLHADLVASLIGLALHETYTRWLSAPTDQPLPALADDVLAELRTTTTALT
ncbi:TetR/AcrR family transcriptional regulator [Catenuloplanes japonicus]|uniref:TetR/AcrR family transcriptional regulator n=1 Tax=Catenuloplanes japonicus TaxID=33876 RepID=UPI0005271991|nr:TetR/AcrR family transcriptional regulator [Catenuloplanes japonicus]